MDVEVGSGIAGTDVDVETAAAVGGAVVGGAVGSGPVVGEGTVVCARALGTDVEVGASCGSGCWGAAVSLLEQATATKIRQTTANNAICTLDMYVRLPV